MTEETKTEAITPEVLPSPKQLLAVREEEILAQFNVDEAQREKFDKVMLEGDYQALTPTERSLFIRMQCARAGLAPDLNPVEFIPANGKLKPYFNKGATEQLRALHGLDAHVTEKQIIQGHWIVQVRVQDKNARYEDDVGTCSASDPQGLKKAVTQAKRRATLAFCGMGALDTGDDSNGSNGPTRVTPPPVDSSSRATIAPVATSTPAVPRPSTDLPDPSSGGATPPVPVVMPAVPRPKAK